MIPEDLKQQISDIAYEMKELTTDPLLREGLLQVFKNKIYNDAQIQAIRTAATPTLLMDIDELIESGNPHINLPPTLTRAFIDSVTKTAALASGFMNLDLENHVSEILYEGKKCLEDIVYNFPLLLGKNIPPMIGHALKEYEKIIPKFEQAYNKLNELQEAPHITDSDKEYYSGRDHLRCLPPNFPTLTNDSTPEPPPEP